MSDQRNRLGDETSPYLIQHKDNPVHWWAWTEDALAKAEAENKPILLSVGYAACHWCHVMAHESFESDETAALMNDLFINIKVDREERPDIDALYQSALQMMGEHGGWPLTMFLTPKGEPYWGGTYFPPGPRYGRPGFPDVLKSVSSAYHDQRAQVDANVASLRGGLEKLSKPEGGGTPTIDDLDKFASGMLRMIDPINGGTMGAPKFPQPTLFRFIWRAYMRTGSTLFREAVTVSLDNMCQGGIYDHLGGGFARYSTDEVWLAPHFEKMLYDNALLLDLLTDAWLATESPLYAVRIRETIEWALREMGAEANGRTAFVSAYDADSEGEEGKFYVWNEAEIDEILGAAAERFKQVYDVSRFGNWEGKVILNRSHGMALLSEEEEKALSVLREKLMAIRDRRVWPSRDDKVLADWNGLMIAALYRAGQIFEEPTWCAAARDAYQFVKAEMTAGDRLHHSWCAGRAAHPGVLEDYANMSRAALTLFEATGDEDFLRDAKSWTAVADDHFWDNDNHGYFMSADDTGDVLVRTKPVHDNATPAGNGIMAEVLARLHHLTGETTYRERFDALVKAVLPTEAERAMHQTALLMGYEIMANPLQVVIAGPAKSEEAEAFYKAAMKAAPPAALFTRLDESTTLPDGHPAHGKHAIDGKPTAYICVGSTCTMPITDTDDLVMQLSAA